MDALTGRDSAAADANRLPQPSPRPASPEEEDTQRPEANDVTNTAIPENVQRRQERALRHRLEAGWSNY